MVGVVRVSPFHVFLSLSFGIKQWDMLVDIVKGNLSASRFISIQYMQVTYLDLFNQLIYMYFTLLNYIIMNFDINTRCE